MAIADVISSMNEHLKDAWDAIHNKGGESVGNDNLENLAAAIEGLSGSATIDFTRNPNAYIGLAGVAPSGEYIVSYIEDESTAQAILGGGYDFSALSITPFSIAFSPKAAELPITAIGNNFLLNQNISSVSGLENLTQVTAIGNAFLAQPSSLFSLSTLGALPPNLSSIGNGFLQAQKTFNEPIVFPESLTTIGDDFLRDTKYNQPIIFPTDLSSIGDNFLYYYDWQNPKGSFNSAVTLPTGAPCTIGSGFMGGQSSYTQPFVIPANITTIGSDFLSGLEKWVGPLTVENSDIQWTPSTYTLASSVAISDQSLMGVLVEGAGAATTLAQLPNQGSRYLVTNRDEVVYGGYHNLSNNSIVRWTSLSDVEAVVNGGTVGSEPSVVGTIGFTANVEGQGITAIGNEFLNNNPSSQVTGMEHFTEVITIGDWYLARLDGDSRNMPGGVTYFPPNVVSIGNSALQSISTFYTDSITMPDLVETVGDNFLKNAHNLNGIHFSESLQHLGNGALYQISFNGTPTLTLPEGLETIGDTFMFNTNTMLKSLTIPSTVQSIGGDFMGATVNFTGPLVINTLAVPADNATSGPGSLSCLESAYNAYTQGVKLTGPGAAAWKEALPDLDGPSSYRKLILDTAA